MKTTRQQMESLLKKAFNADGSFNPSNSRQRTARKLLKVEGLYDYEEKINGYDIHNSLLIVAYPNRQI